jgi:predicted RNA-binding protein with PIN domain
LIEPAVHWLIDGNNVFGARPDGWWNDRPAAMQRFTQRVAEWCRTHADDVIVVFDQPVPESVLVLAGGNLRVVAAPRRGRDAADDEIARRAAEHVAESTVGELTIVTSDRGLRARLAPDVTVIGAGRFRGLIGY